MSPDRLVKILALIPLPMGFAIAKLFGFLAAKLHLSIYEVSLENIQLCLPELSLKVQQVLAKRSVQESAKVIFETAKAWTHSRPYSVKQFIAVDNLAIFQSALASGKPLLLLAPHLGNWEILGTYIREHKRMTTMYLPPKKEELHQFIIKSRNALDLDLAPANRKGVSQVLKALKKGDFVAILPDQEPDLDGGEFAPFFNQPALTMTLVHKLIQRADCIVLMAYAKRIKGGFEAVFREPEADIYASDSQTSLKALNHSVELLVREAPEQYQWEYKRFKQHPSGQKKLRYRKKR